jgi:regulator of sirC expression with transglutaminase-like and TPR domain
VSSHSGKFARARFAEMVLGDDDAISLAEAALLIAAEEYPRLDTELYLEKLDRFADIARERMLKSGDMFDFTATARATTTRETVFSTK